MHSTTIMMSRHATLTRLAVGLFSLLLGLSACRPEAEAPVPLDLEGQRLVALGDEALQRQEFALALALADSAAADNPGAVEVDFLRGLIYTRMMQWEDAAAAYRRVAERKPDFPGLWNNLGTNAIWRGAYQEALSYLYREVAERPAPLPWNSIGRVYRELGVVDSAAYAFEQAIRLDSSYVPAHVSYAEMLEEGGEFDRALELANRAAALAPTSAEVRYLLGSLLARVGRDEEALPHLQAVTEAWPWHTESHYKLGQALQRVGHSEESRRALAEAERLWKLQADVSAYQKGVATDPENPYAHAALASAYRMAGRYDEAIRTYRIALTLDPKNLEFQNNLASLHFLERDTVGAIRIYRQILQQDPSMPDVWVNLGVLHALSGESAEARMAWQNALALRPEDPKVRGYLARLDAGPAEGRAGE